MYATASPQESLVRPRLLASYVMRPVGSKSVDTRISATRTSHQSPSASSYFVNRESARGIGRIVDIITHAAALSPVSPFIPTDKRLYPRTHRVTAASRWKHPPALGIHTRLWACKSPKVTINVLAEPKRAGPVEGQFRSPAEAWQSRCSVSSLYYPAMARK